MPRPKGCTCGTPKPCKIHADSADAGAAREYPGGRPQDGAGVVGAEPFLRAIEGAGHGDGKPAGELRDTKRSRKSDPAPKPRRERQRKPVAPDKPDDAALVAMLGELLTMPAIPAAMLLDCAYCRDHFISEGPKAARELVALSLVNPALRSALESIHAGWTKLTIAGVLAGYLAKPLLHHVAPEPVLAAAGPVIGVPPRPEKPKPHKHAHGTTEAQYPGEVPESADDDGSAAEDQYAGAEAG